MARMRTLKPEYWTDSVIVGLSPLARLLYMGMWNFADDVGILEDDALALKLQILPAEPCNVEDLLDELVKSDRVRRATTPAGKRVLHVVRFLQHQKIDNPGRPRFCKPEELTFTVPPKPRESSPSPPVALPESSPSPPVALAPEVGSRKGGEKNLRDEPRELPTKPDPDRSLADTITEWLALQGVDLAPPERLSDRFGELVEVITDGAKRPTDVTRGVQRLCAEYVEATTGQQFPQPGWGHLGRLISDYGPRKAFHGVVEAVVGGAGIDPPHDVDARALTKYAAAVLGKERAPPGQGA